MQMVFHFIESFRLII